MCSTQQSIRIKKTAVIGIHNSLPKVPPVAITTKGVQKHSYPSLPAKGYTEIKLQ